MTQPDTRLPSCNPFPAIKAADPVWFNPTHRRIETGELVELLSDGPEIFTYPTMYPHVLVRDNTGRKFVISEEVWDRRDKKKRFVNYEPLTKET